jgi:hypothetical protein
MKSVSCCSRLQSLDHLLELLDALESRPESFPLQIHLGLDASLRAAVASIHLVGHQP